MYCLPAAPCSTHVLGISCEELGQPLGNPETSQKLKESVVETCMRRSPSSKFVSENYSATGDDLTNYDLRVVLHAKYCDISFFDMCNQGTGRMTLGKNETSTSACNWGVPRKLKSKRKC